MAAESLWRSRPVFITSTFRDMNAERDWLCTRVFPELRDRLRARCHHLETIDLRWGVESASEQDEHAREMLVLKVCLGEIVRSRPFLIGLLGDRYGYQPPPARIRAAAKEAGLERDVAGKSVTELEILFGVLESSEQQRRSWFYLREPLPYAEMPRELAARFSERHNTEQGAAAKADRLDALKQRLLTELPERTRRYRAGWDAEHNAVTGLQGFGDQVRDDLWGDLVAETDAFLQQAPQTWQGQDRWALDEFVEDRSRGFVGREAITAELLALARSPASDEDVWGACVTAEAGAGKSGLFAHLHRELVGAGVLLLAHAAGISVQSASVDRMLRRWVSELASFLNENDPLGDDAKVEDIDREFARLLYRASMQKRVVVLVDALNQFEPSTRGQHVTWLPKLWPDNARLITTTIAGTQSEAMVGRPRVREVKLPPIDRGEAAAIVRGICKGYHRDLNPRVVDALLAKMRQDGQVAHGSPLWLELAVEELNLLDADDFERADVEFAAVPPGAERMVRLLLAAVAAMPAEVADAYGVLFHRAEKLFGAPWARAFLELTAVSRGGWREADLQVLMPRRSGVAWDELAFAGLRRILRAHVAQRGGQGQWDFTHAQMREAVRVRMGTQTRGDSNNMTELHQSIAGYLFGLERADMLRASETLFHTIQGDSIKLAARFYAEATMDTDRKACTTVARDYLAIGLPDRSPPYPDRLRDVASLPELEGLELAERHALCDRLNWDLHNAIDIAAMRLDLLLAVRESTDRLFAEHSTDQCLPFVNRMREQQALLSLGNHEEARKAADRALAIAEWTVKVNPTCRQALRSVSAARQAIGSMLAQRGKLDEAHTALERCLSDARMLATSDTSDMTLQHDVAIASMNMGDLLWRQLRHSESAEHLRYALEILESIEGRALTTQFDETSPGVSWKLKRFVAGACHGLARALLAKGASDEAHYYYERARHLIELLGEQDPADMELQRDMFVVLQGVGDAARKTMAWGDARSAYEEAKGVADRAARIDPSSEDWQQCLAMAWSRMGDVYMAEGMVDCAIAAYERDLAITEKLTRRKQ